MLPNTGEAKNILAGLGIFELQLYLAVLLDSWVWQPNEKVIQNHLNIGENSVILKAST